MTSNGEPVSPSAAAAASPDTRQDPAMKALFRMSRTAGVGLQDYAAVNAPSVVGLLLGIASFLAVAWRDSVAVLIFPIAAAVVSIVAFTQIRRSNGTQTGQVLAIAGLVLAIAFAGVNLASHAKTSARENAWKGELNAVAAKLMSGATTQGMQSSYELFDDRFREAIKFETFDRIMRPRMSVIASVKVGDLVVFEDDDLGNTTATTLMIFEGQHKLPDGSPMLIYETTEFRRTPEHGWQIHSLPGWFGSPAKGQNPG